MASLLVRRLSRLLPSCQNHYPAVLTSLFHSPLSISTQSHQLENAPFLAQYLVSSFGFSADRALRVAALKYFTAIKSRDRPDSVVSFLKEIGFSDSQIGSLISSLPILLSLNVVKTLKPKACALMDAGFTGEVFIQLILSNPQCLYLKDTLPRLRFWYSFVGNSDKVLLKVIKNNASLITCDINNHIMPRINLLREYGLSDQVIVKLITKNLRFMWCGVDRIRFNLEKTEELGLSRESNMFFQGLLAVSSLKKETLERKVELCKKIYGWSEKEVCSAFKKTPTFLALSEETISSKMDFLIKKAGFEPRSIASQSKLLSSSLERVLVPRHNVLSTLQAKELEKRTNLLSVCVISEERFLKRFVVPYEKDLPELAESYAAACAGKLPS